MTARELRQLSPSALDALYRTLSADRLPFGTFDGVVWPVPAWPAWWWLWKGKVFGIWHERLSDLSMQSVVKNRIGPLLLIRGDVSLAWQGGEVLIDYPQLGLRDHLKPVSDSLWLGWLDLRGHRIYFTLEQTRV